MNKEFVKYEQALALAELGFDEPCFGYYDEGGNLYTEMVEVLKAPLYQQAFSFFREKHGLYSWVTMELGNKSTFCWVLSGEHTSTQYAAYFHTYEEAESACLDKLIEIVRNTKS